MGLVTQDMIEKKVAARMPWTGNFDLKSVNEELRTIDITFSTSKKDWDGDVIDSEGLNFTKFNGTVLWAHDHSIPGVMKLYENSIKILKNSASATIEFDGLTDFGKQLFDLAKQGFVKGWSFGFFPTDYEPIVINQDGKEITTGFHIKSAEVYEISAVNVGANHMALSKAFKGIKNIALRMKLLEKELIHGDNVKDSEPKWKDINKSELPNIAHAFYVDDKDKSTWKYPHHFISDDFMFLHKGGLNAAWAAFQKDKDNLEDDMMLEIEIHLQNHRDALNMKILTLSLGKDDKLTVEGEKDFKLTALEKSFKERGAAGKMPIFLKLIKDVKSHFEIQFETIKENNGVITEAKVVSVTLYVPTPNDKSTSEDEGQKKSFDIKSLKHSIQKELEKAKLALIISEELECLKH